MEGKRFGQRRPPLSVTIRQILDRYPDGQIFKEMIQNADDAGAKTVQFFIDSRQHRTHTLVHPDLAAYEGPALIAANDAQFSDQDWEGIQSLQQSIKVEDPFKVGRFGIGFNSVYHISDVPAIISGERVAYLDPQEKIWAPESGRLFDLYTLQRTDALAPFNGIAGFQSTGMVSYPKTLFRFPLRRRRSNLSGNVYTVQKLQELIDALREEAKYLLLFLRSIETIEVNNISQRGIHSLSFRVQITSPQQIRQERESFMEQLTASHNLHPYNINRTISFTATFQIDITDHNHSNNQSGSSRWLVANCVGTNNATILNAAAQLHVFPWVGSVLELPHLQGGRHPTGGRIYCFLPLPLETSSHLPVNVNGTFSLNDDRRTLKWPGQERRNDPWADWNQMLVTQLLPHCYAMLLAKGRECLQSKQFYKAWPDIKKVRGTTWEGLLQPLFRAIFSQPSFWCDGTHDWILLKQATLTPIPPEAALKDVVKRVLTACGMKLVDVPTWVWNAIEFCKLRSSVSRVLPMITRREMRACGTSYSRESSDSKLELLSYCLSDKNYRDLHGLNLLPLANETFASFLNPRMSRSNRAVPLYVCSKECPQYLLPNIDHLLVNLSDEDLQKELHSVASSGETQLHNLSVQAVATLLPQCFPEEWSFNQTISLPSPSFPMDWFETFWRWVQRHNLSLFANQPIIPLAVSNTQHGFKVTRLTATSSCSVMYILYSDSCLPDLLNALTKLKVQCTFQKHVSYLQHSQLYDYVHNFNPSGVLTAIANANQFHVAFTPNEVSMLRGFLASRMPMRLSFSQQNVLNNLTIFETENKSGLYSVTRASKESWNGKSILQPSGFSISTSSFPTNLVMLSRDRYSSLLQDHCTSHVSSPSTLEFVVDVAFPMIRSGAFPDGQIDSFMEQVFRIFSTLKQQSSFSYHYQSSSTFVSQVGQLPFLKTSPYDSSRKAPNALYDPSKEELKKLYQGESVFPIEPFTQYLDHLRECGLRVSVTGQELITILNSVSTNASHVPQSVGAVRVARAKAVLSYIRKHDHVLSEKVSFKSDFYFQTLDQAIQMLSKGRSFFPVLSSPPENYPECLFWKGGRYTSHLVSHNKNVLLCGSGDIDTLPHIVGSQMYVVECPSKICTLLNTDPPITAALSHFQQIIEHKRKIERSQLDTLVHQIYTFLSKHLQSLKECRDLPLDLSRENWIWLKRYHSFVSSSDIFVHQHFSFEYSLSPYLYQIPEELRSSKYSALFTYFGVHRQLTDSQIISVLRKIDEDTDDKVSPQQQWKMVKHILEWLTSGGDRLATSILTNDDSLYVPIESECQGPQLMSVEEVVYTDLEFLKHFTANEEGDEEPVMFIHHQVAHLARSLGVQPLSRHLNIAEDAFGDVGPHEPLITRLKNILRDYKDGLTIVKELLQNADDAEATELNICYDARSHKTKPRSLLFSGMSESHGPALVVHNNAVFSDKDFENITKLAGATKQNEPLKIGKFGVGFCSVYHITDIPSFVSRDWLYVFDPTISYLKKEIEDRARPGKKLRFTERLVRHSQQLKPYQGLFQFNPSKEYRGTLFRFPFRTASSDISGLRYGESHIDQLLSDIMKAGPKLMLFLKNVRKISFSRIRSGDRQPTKLLQVEKKRESFILSPSTSNGCISCAEIVKFDTSTYTAAPRMQQKYCLTASYASAQTSPKYSIASIACSLESSPSDAVMGENSYMPIEETGEMFCFLPLSLQTGLPVHVSSNFAVLNDRSGIHSTDNESRRSDEVLWNIRLMKNFIPRAYQTLLLALQKMCMEGTVSTEEYQFHLLWPNKDLLKIHNPWDLFLNSLYEQISSSDLFYSSNEEWITLDESKIISPAILSSVCHSTPQCVVDVIDSLQYSIVNIPHSLQKEFPTDKINECTIDEEEFLEIFSDNVDCIMIDTRNEVLFSLLQEFAVDRRKLYLSNFLKQNRIVPCTPNGSELKKCSEVINPHSAFSKLYEPEDGVFPVSQFHEDSLVRTALVQLGMISDQLPWAMLIERAQTVETIYSQDTKSALKRTSLVLKCIDDYTLLGTLPTEASQLLTIHFLPVMKRQQSYPAMLKWAGEGKHLLNSRVLLRYGSNTVLAGSQLPIVYESDPENGGCGTIPHDVSKVLGFQSQPDFQNVVNHLCHIIDSEMTSHDVEWIEDACDKIYKFLELELTKDSDSDLSILTEMNSIWTGTEFIGPSYVATSWSHSGPYLYAVPHLLKNKSNLVKALNIQSEFSVDQLLDALNRIRVNFGSEQISSREIKVISELTSALQNQLGDTELTEDQICYLPDKYSHMRDSKNLAYNDAPWCAVDIDCYFVHPKFSRETAIKLKVMPVRSKALERYEAKHHHFEGVEFGQREELTQRIKNILSEYPCDVTVIKELLQNADDAKATKMYIILDKRKHGTKRIPSSEWNDLQGPALLVWNDSGFSDEDLIGIQKLGIGSKRSQLESIGQYGIGFNVVYHLTDCPSFLTNGNTLCVFDPHCRYVPGANEKKPGRQYNDLDEHFWKNWKDLKSPYLRDGIKGCPSEISSRGTLFRFPLRHEQRLVDQSELTNEENDQLGISNKPISSWKMEVNIREWAPKMKEALIFLNHVTELKFFVIEDFQVPPRMIPTHHYKVNLDQSALDSRKLIQEKTSLFTENNKQPCIVSYPINLCEETPQKNVEQLLIQQGVGDIHFPEQHWEYLSQIKPKHGIAAQIRGSDFKGSVFCFLPLPLESRLPVHVNGNFILDAARSGLWQSRDAREADDRKKWNLRLIEAIASSYTIFLVKCQGHFIFESYTGKEKMWSAIRHYYSIFPRWDTKSCPEAEMKELALCVFRKLGKHNAKVLVAIEKQEKFSAAETSQRASRSSISSPQPDVYSTEWLCLRCPDEPNKQAYFWKSSEKLKAMPSILKRIGMKLTAAPMWVRKHFEKVDIELPEASPFNTYQYYSKFFQQVSPQGTFPCDIKSSAFKSVKDFLEFTKYVVVEEHIKDEGTYGKFPTPPFGVPLLLTANEQLHAFSEENKVIHSKYSQLFPACGDRFLHPQLLEVRYLRSYFVEPDQENRELVLRIFNATLPPSLCADRVYDASDKINIQNMLKPLWECLQEDVFKIHVKDILKQWALTLSCKNQLFRYQSTDQLLPAIPPPKPRQFSFSFTHRTIVHNENQNVQVYEMLQQRGLPVLEILVSSLSHCMKFCPQFSQPQRILTSVFFLFQYGEFSTNMFDDNKIEVLFEYFGRIHFAQDEESLAKVKSLPLFKNIDGKYCDITDETYIWPGSICTAGRDMWIRESGTIFLKQKGTWSKLGQAAMLGIREVTPLVVYRKFIFPHFHLLTEADQIKQLQHIRDDKALFDTAWHDSKLEDNSERKQEGALFVAALQQLPCLLNKNGDLKPLCEFCDPEAKIFQTFPENFAFPPAHLRDKKWLEFFRKIGLRSKITKEEFISFCERISSGQHNKILEGSKVLLEHLFSEKEWHNDGDFLYKVSKISFVSAERLDKLAWIKPVCEADNRIVQKGKSIHLTSLRKSALYKTRNLVWTVMPVVRLPSFPFELRKTWKEIERFHRLIGVCTTPSCSAVVTNILTISESRFANFKLFDKYNTDCHPPKGSEKLLFTVLAENYSHLKEQDCNPYELRVLKGQQCIPVNNEGQYHSTTTPVLVPPLQVIASNSSEVRNFIPFINPLPSILFSAQHRVLDAIGVMSDIQLPHISFALQTIHKYVQPKVDDPNTLGKLKLLLRKLYELSVKNSTSRGASLDDTLYLPNKHYEMKESKTLLFDDKGYYRDARFDLSGLPYFMASLLTKSFKEINVYGFRLEQFCSILPDHVRPLPFSTSCIDRLHAHCEPQDPSDQSDFGAKLKKTLQLEIGKCAQLILAHNSPNREACVKFGNALELFRKSLQVLTVPNLKVDVYLNLVKPPRLIGTAKVDFYLMKSDDDSSFYLYLDKEAHPLVLDLIKSLTKTIVSHVIDIARIDQNSLHKPHKVVKMLLQVSSNDELRLVLNRQGIDSTQLTLEDNYKFDDMIPKLGASIPEEWHHHLQSDINNVFRPQDWVGFEVSDNHFIFALVEHRIQLESESQDDEEEELEDSVDLPFYLIRISEEDEEGKVVSGIDLYKFLRICEVQQDDGSVELVLYDGESEGVQVWNAIRDVKLKDIMREICAELRRIWKIKDKDQKRKAIKAMYLKWHPDKNNSPFATKAFQFLQRQIKRLQQGLQLEDPEGNWENETNLPHDQYWDGMFNTWSDIASRHGRNWQRERDYYRSGGGSYSSGGGGIGDWGWERIIRVSPDPSKAKVWLKQAEHDLTALRLVLQHTDITQEVSAHACFLAHQVAEKALKAGMYKVRGLYPEDLRFHQLTSHAGALEQLKRPLTPGLQMIARTLQGYYLHTRYPNLYNPDSVPSDHFGPSDAQEAEHIASNILRMMKDVVDS